MSVTIIRGDARALPLPDESVDLLVTSPPYYGLRSYTDGGRRYEGQIGAEPTPCDYIAKLLEATREWMRVLKPTGSIFVNLGDKYSERTDGKQRSSDGAVGRGRQAGVLPQTRSPLEKSLLGLPWMYALGCIYELGLILRAEIIWDKPTPLPESVTDRVCRSHEQWFHFARQQRYFANLDAIREPHVAPRRKAGVSAFGARNANIVRTATGEYVGQNPLGKIPDTVWTVAAQPLRVPDHLDVDHDAAFPTEWPRRLIQGWSPDGGVVVDPFGGSGTTALVADVFGRRGISIDRSADYCRLAAWRTSDAAERAKALGVTPPAKPMDGQGDLFEVAS